MKKVILMLALCAPMSLFAQKFGHLDSQAFLQSLPEATNVQKQLEAKGQEYEKQLTDMQKELQNKAEQYDKNKSTMNATKQQETEAELQEMYQKIQQTAADNQKAFNEEQQKQLSPILDKVRKAIENVAKAGNYVYIMEQNAGQPLFVNTAISKDVTNEVKAEYNKLK